MDEQQLNELYGDSFAGDLSQEEKAMRIEQY